MRRVLTTAFVAVVLVGVFVFVLPRIADYGTVWTSCPGWPAGPADPARRRARERAHVPRRPGWPRCRGSGTGRRWSSPRRPPRPPRCCRAATLGAWARSTPCSRAGASAAPGRLAVVVTGVWNQLVNVAFPVSAGCCCPGTARRRTAADRGDHRGGRVRDGDRRVRDPARPGGHARGIGNLAARMAARVMAVIGRVRRPAWGDARRCASGTRASRSWHTRWPHPHRRDDPRPHHGLLVLLAAIRAVGIGAGQVSAVECFAAWSLNPHPHGRAHHPGRPGRGGAGAHRRLVGFGGDQEPVVAAVLAYRCSRWCRPSRWAACAC